MKKFPLDTEKTLRLTERPDNNLLRDICSDIRSRIQSLTSETPTSSIIVSAHNEEMYMLTMLWSMSNLVSKHGIEFIGVDNASTDRTAQIFQQCGFHLIEESKKGVSYARQAGLSRANGKYIFSTDADTQVPHLWVDRCLEYFDRNSNLVCFSGGVKKFPGSLFGYTLLRKTRNTLFKRKEGFESFAGLNMVFQRETAMNVGGYEPGINLGEDILLAHKLGNCGELMYKDNDPDCSVIASGRRIASVKQAISLVKQRGSKLLKPTSPQEMQINSFPDFR